MKKLIFILVIMIMGFTALIAQDIQFGAKAGLNLATLQPDFTDPATRTSFHLGGMVQIPLMDALYLQPELLYSAQGVRDKSDDDEVIKLDYLTIPVMARYLVWETLSVEVGPQFGMLLSAKREDDGETEDIKDIAKTGDIGFTLGLGYKLENGLTVGIRYFLGSDINDDKDDPDAVKNRVFQISLGYFF